MCGLAGIIGLGITQIDASALKTLAWVSGLRGMDGAGIIQGTLDYRNKLNYFTEKGSMNIIEFMEYHQYVKEGNSNVMNDISDNFMLLHTRGASRGSVTPENAHPFEFDNIVGQHNGTLKDKKYEHDTQTDSELMFADMDANGIIPVLSALDPKSAFALVILNKNEGEINIVRNKERSLFYMIHRTRNVMYYASERSFLNFMKERHNLDCCTIEVFKENVLYSLNPRDVKGGFIPKWKETSIFTEGEPELPTNPAPLITAQGGKGEKGKGGSGGKKGKGRYTDHNGNLITVGPVKTGNLAIEAGAESVDASRFLSSDSTVSSDGSVINLEEARKLIAEGKAARIERKNSSEKERPAIFDAPWHNTTGVCFNPRIIPTVNCIYCKRQLSLYEQYKGVKIDKGMVSCEACEEEQSRIFQEQNVRIH